MPARRPVRPFSCPNVDRSHFERIGCDLSSKPLAALLTLNRSAGGSGLLTPRGHASVDHGLGDPFVRAQGLRHDIAYAGVGGRSRRHQSRDVFGGMSTRGQHERVDHHHLRSAFHTTGESSVDIGCGELHVGDFDDAPLAKARFYHLGHAQKQFVGLRATAAVIDQQERGELTHVDVSQDPGRRGWRSIPVICDREHHGSRSGSTPRARSDTCRERLSKRTDVASTEQVHVHENGVELIEGHPIRGARRERPRFLVGAEDHWGEAAKEPHHR